MQPLAPHPAYGLLSCPICRLDLAPRERSFVCRNGHNFDLARSGYVNLMGGQSRLPAAGGDTREQLARREAFLGTGHFDVIAEAIARERLARGGVASQPTLAILDAGCGTGYHLARLMALLSGPAEVRHHSLGLDISKEAAHFAAGRRKGMAFAVADIWREWPVRAGIIDLLISVFAPKNFPEMSRVLAPDGLVAIAYPGPGHLAELRSAFGLMTMREDKAALYLAAARRHLGETRWLRLGRRVALGREQVLNAILMGPDARRLPMRGLPAWSGTMMATIEIELLLAQRHP